MAILIALIPFFTWAFSDVCVTIASRKIGNTTVSVAFLFLSFLLVSLYLPFAGPLSSWFYFGVAFALGGVHVTGLLSYYKGLEVGNASLVGAIVGSFAVFIVLLSLLLFHESLNLFQIVGVALSIVGLLLTSFNKTVHIKKIFSDPGAGFALITFFAWGLYFTLIRIPVEKIGWYWALYPATFYFLLLILLPSIRSRLSRKVFDKKTLGYILLMTILGRTGDFAYNIALTRGFSSIVGAVAGVSPVLFVLLARFIFKEKLTLQQKIGIASTISGIVFIAFGSL